MRIGQSPSWIELLTGEAGGAFMEFAVLGFLVLVFCMLLLLAWNKSTRGHAPRGIQTTAEDPLVMREYFFKLEEHQA